MGCAQSKQEAPPKNKKKKNKSRGKSKKEKQNSQSFADDDFHGIGPDTTAQNPLSPKQMKLQEQPVVKQPRVPTKQSRDLEAKQAAAFEGLLDTETRLFKALQAEEGPARAKLAEAVGVAEEFDDFEEEPARRCSMNHKENAEAKSHGANVMQRSRNTTSPASSGPVNPMSRMGVKKHDSEDDCWVIVRGVVYDVTPLLDTHPGGVYSIVQHAGGDATRAFEDSHNPKPFKQLERYRKGNLSD
jgi:cytochrome b involved in lipid metabolism